jgi:hypothetical protein
MFAIHEMIEVEMMTFHALARVRAVDGDRLHVALEPGSYLPWIDAPALVRGPGALEGVDARVLRACMTTALLELRPPGVMSGPPPPESRDTQTDEAC